MIWVIRTELTVSIVHSFTDHIRGADYTGMTGTGTTGILLITGIGIMATTTRSIHPYTGEDTHIIHGIHLTITEAGVGHIITGGITHHITTDGIIMAEAIGETMVTMLTTTITMATEEALILLLQVEEQAIIHPLFQGQETMD